MVVLRVEMGLCRQTKLDAKLKIRRAIADVEVESGLARSTCPDIDHLPEASDKEGFLCEREGGGGVDDGSGLGRSWLEHFHI